MNIVKKLSGALIVNAFLMLLQFNSASAAIFDGGPGNGCPDGELCSPLKSDDIGALFLGILDVLLTFAIPIIVLFIMYAGFLYVTAQGDETKIKRAHSALTWSIIGGVIVLAAKLIIEVIQNTVNAL